MGPKVGGPHQREEGPAWAAFDSVSGPALPSRGLGEVSEQAEGPKGRGGGAEDQPRLGGQATPPQSPVARIQAQADGQNPGKEQVEGGAPQPAAAGVGGDVLSKSYADPERRRKTHEAQKAPLGQGGRGGAKVDRGHEDEEGQVSPKLDGIGGHEGPQRVKRGLPEDQRRG